ncbi:hypothetical protein E2C01_011198 [Portunus trituberculatus]|uniref:Uncharacterized protein n=1 Tax=Portunus trituberculatus TaxID=210409 RepID=A0A5B7DAS9_PORTR|nr:hypothetical protein [Portunus trituberculatus]
MTFWDELERGDTLQKNEVDFSGHFRSVIDFTLAGKHAAAAGHLLSSEQDVPALSTDSPTVH